MNASLKGDEMDKNKILWFIVVALLIINSVVILRSQELIAFPGELTKLEMARAGTNAMITYLRRYATDLGVADINSVKERIGLLQYKIELATSEEDLAQIILTESGNVQETILREADNLRNQVILGIISKDPNLNTIQEKVAIVVWGDVEYGVQVSDVGNVLSAETITALKESPQLPHSFSDVAVTIEDGSPKVLSYRSLYDRLSAMELETAQLQQSLISQEERSGYRALSGHGIQIKIYDAEGGYQAFEIVHDSDIRDILNELFSAGALGASVGGQRIINTSSIRCVGPVILVNYESIAVDPVTIQVVGDVEKLTSGIEIIKNTLESIKGISIVVEEMDVVLPAYSRKVS